MWGENIIMRVLWITNVPTPSIARDADLSVTPYGGWLVQLAEQLRLIEDVKLSFLFAQSERKMQSLDQ